MRGRIRFGFILSLLLSLLLSTPKSYAQESLPTISQQIEGSELKLLLKTLEDPEERDKFIKQLKSLIALQKKEEPAHKEKEIIPALERKLKATNVFLLYQKAVQGLGDLSNQVRENVKEIPSHFYALGQYFSQKENIFFVLDMVIKLLLTSLIGWVVFFYVRKYLHHFKQSLELKEEVSFWEKVRITSTNVGIEIMPLFSLLFVWLLFAVIVGLESWLRNSITLIIVSILAAKALSAIAAKVLAPENATQRLIPCSEELAIYFFLWTKRFVYYSVYGCLPLVVGAQIGLSERSLSVLWAIYKLGLVGLAALFILQWKDSIRERFSVEEQGGIVRQSLARVYNLVLGKLYILIILYFLALLAIASFGNTGTALQLIFRMMVSLLIIGMGVGFWLLVGFFFDKMFFVGDRVKERFPGLEAKVNRYISFVQIGINMFIFVMSSILVLEAWGLDLADFMVAGLGGIIIKRIVSIGMTIGLALLAIDASQYFVQKVLMDKAEVPDKGIELSKRIKTFLPLFNNLIKYVTFFIAGMIILSQLGIDITPILAGAGVLGLAVGFGAQSLVKDIISGFFILFEDLISVGDVVIIKGTGGLVEAVNLRTIRLRDLSGNVHVIPNSNIDMVTNMTKEYSRYVLDLGVSYREDIDKVIQVVKEIGEELRNDPYYGPNILEPLEVLGVDNFGESEVTVKFRITTKPIKQWETARELRRRIKKVFDAKGIEIPFPHRTIYFGDPKYQAPQPLFIKLETTPAYAAREDDNPEKTGNN